MKLALFDDHRVGVVGDDESSLVDVTEELPEHDVDLGASFWVRMCRDLAQDGERLRAAGSGSPAIPLERVRLRAPVLNPSKIVAAALNYTGHIEEMRPRGVTMLDFDVFLKAPSSIADPASTVRLPDVATEIHYEGELACVVGTAGRDIPESSALDHIAGWTILLDMTVRGKGDRSRRKSYDGFTPIGPWLVTADEVSNWQDLRIELLLNGDVRQDVLAGEMINSVPELISHASSVMTLLPGDVIATGAPPGVGAVAPGDRVEASITGLGRLEVSFSRPRAVLQAPVARGPRQA